MQARPMANKEIMDKVIKIVVEKLEVKAWEATARASFVDDLGADSLDIVQLVSALEETFGIEIEDEKVQSMVTVGQAAEVIEELLKEKV